jgi:hypothetical protein
MRQGPPGHRSKFRTCSKLEDADVVRVHQEPHGESPMLFRGRSAERKARPSSRTSRKADSSVIDPMNLSSQLVRAGPATSGRGVARRRTASARRRGAFARWSRRGFGSFRRLSKLRRLVLLRNCTVFRKGTPPKKRRVSRFRTRTLFFILSRGAHRVAQTRKNHARRLPAAANWLRRGRARPAREPPPAQAGLAGAQRSRGVNCSKASHGEDPPCRP